MLDVSCTIKSLPTRLHEEAAETAIAICPENAPGVMPFDLPQPQYIGLMTTKYWGPQPRTLTVRFMEVTPGDLAARILSHMNAWDCCVTFAETGGSADVRVSLLGDGYWSYLGTDILHVPAYLPTMNLQGFSMAMPESEFHRVVRHEAGHTIGFSHEHMRRDLVARIDPARAVRYFGATQGWSPQMVAEQVLTPLEESSIYGTPADQTSIMCYQLPGSITFDGQPIVGGLDINASDRAFAELIYPVARTDVYRLPPDDPHLTNPAPSLASRDSQHWPASHDVAVDLSQHIIA